MSSAVPIVAIVGPTAAGKTSLSLDLAERLGGEIVNTDAMQVYRGMDIGTAKLPESERRGIPHHLLNLLEVTETATVAEFQGLARRTIAELRGRGVVPVLVGGSALYTRAILDRFEFPGRSEEVRARWQAELDSRGPEALHAVLAERDPAAAALILPSNGRRIVRALEAIEVSGRPFSASLPEKSYVFDAVLQVGVDIDRPTLDARIEARVRHMFEVGLVEEVRSLERSGLREGLTASRALGYQQVLSFLAGECSEEEAVDATVRGTRRFARRQDSWFRKDERVHWVRWDDPHRLDRAVELVEEVAGSVAEG
jgi:tRNA dimethylallyltransferase